MQRPPAMLALTAIAVLLFCAGSQAGVPLSDETIYVTVQKRGATVIVDVRAEVATNAATAWAVLTDYAHMADFISNLKTSVVLKREGNHLEVMQTGGASKGPFAFSFETRRAIELLPQQEIRSHLIEGNFETNDYTTRIIDNGSTVVIVNHGEYVPNVWVPPVIGPAMIEAETRKQFGEIRAEMLRRSRL